MRTLFLVPLLFPSLAAAVPLALSTFGPGMAPCGDQMCVDVSWLLEGDTTNPAGQIALDLPRPDPEVWELSSGFLASSGGAQFGGWFDREV